jgi:alkylhydroperoxidase family enzyme
VTSWLASAPDDSLEGLLTLRPDLAEAYEAFAGRLWRDRLVDPVVLELCRLRVAQLLGDEPELRRRTPEAVAAGLDEAAVAELSSWPTSPRFAPAPRVALGLAEQFVVDPHGVSDDQMAEVRAHVGDAGVVALTTALGLFDGFARMRTTLRED